MCICFEVFVAVKSLSWGGILSTVTRLQAECLKNCGTKDLLLL